MKKPWTLQRKWTYASAISIFLSFLMMCIILYFSLFNWLQISEEKIAQNTLDEVTHFFKAIGPIISIQDIQKNRTLLNQLVNQKQSIRVLNEDGIEILRINDASDFPKSTSLQSEEFVREEINGNEVFHKVSEIDFGLFKGYVQISHSLESFSQLMNYILIAMGIFALITLVLSALIGYMLSSVLLKPMKELRDEMQLAKQTKFSKIVSFQYEKEDEIGELLKIYKELMDEVSKTITRQDEFIHNVSHELRTPVQVVEGHLSLLNRWGKEDRSILDESLEISLNEIQKMKLLIEEMLKLAKNEFSNKKETTSVVSVLQQLQQYYLPLSPEAIIDIKGQEQVKVMVPATALEQILRNLIENALKYNDNRPYIKAAVQNIRDQVQITVEDNGVGIPEDALSKIFERFYTVEEARTKNNGGSGLGLSIVKSLVIEYAGTISVASEEGKGTKFYILFPKFTSE
ncbi:two-component system, OmpR family, sensor histidine kinase ArlS [Psychrobacillus sp. OK028]|uniref:HAMP domain-containing sensor histidine kinase n=1 Tax=Psychrobacillus sp. OK028 TaxID=1884359 RepID=UPI0008863208|nr:HAMP domain-containing histidine kinase [Psychrobacillus sp. OK028]SDN07477.1 two-component system, OmpR family, sensor histidine kinase ArlS [Psychrobacillus sp. OK028]